MPNYLENRRSHLISAVRYNERAEQSQRRSLEEGAVDKLLVGELGEDRVQHGDGHQD